MVPYENKNLVRHIVNQWLAQTLELSGRSLLMENSNMKQQNSTMTELKILKHITSLKIKPNKRKKWKGNT